MNFSFFRSYHIFCPPHSSWSVHPNTYSEYSCSSHNGQSLLSVPPTQAP
jgi:hypothetical protein